ncbi:MAG: rRNA pseudouridine synthase [Candidatus Riflebacteria bacterium]|nr:rRNA pseudouridine synthase [Candidatus Riflebacteria bacterium]
MVRIQKLLASWGVASRRSIEKYIEDGRISIDGVKLEEQGFIVDEDNLPAIFLDGKEVKPPEKTEYSIFLFNKPKLVITSLKDEKGRCCLADYLPRDKRLYPVGRLDYDSSGLLLITDYGELTNRLLHPSYKVPKEYIVKIQGEMLNQSELKQFSSGIKLEDGLTAPCSIRPHKTPNTYSVIIKEGRKRQVRRMFEFFGRKVINLHRVAFGPIKLGNLQSGKLRPVTEEEKKALLKSTGLI